MKENRQLALKSILVFEGGMDDDPRDPGGRTKNGIIQRVYDADRRRRGLPTQDVFKMTDAERDNIYFRNYFDKVRFDELPPGIDLMLVDGGVNAGPSQAIKWTQRALGLTADGVLGDVTMERIQSHPNHDLLIRQSIDRRNAFYRGLKTFKTFGKGWLSRTAQLSVKAQRMAMGDNGPVVTYVPNGNKKATPLDFKPLPALGAPSAVSAGGGVSSVLTTAQTTLEPLGANEHVATILMYIAVASAVVTAAGLAWAWYAKRQRDELIDVLDLVQTQAQAVNDNAFVPEEVITQYANPNERGTETGNIGRGVVTASGRTAGDTEVRVNPEQPIPAEKIDKVA